MKIFTQYTLIVGLLLSRFTGLYAQDFPRDTSYTFDSAFEKYIEDYPEITSVTPALPGVVSEFRDIVYKNTGTRDLYVDVYRPAEVSQNESLPAVLMVHGGGWISGDRSLLYFMATYLATNNFVTVSVEYRLSPEAQYPAAVYDIKTAIKWMKDHAEDWGIDKDRVAILGTSAGGQLAALAGATADNLKFEDPSDSSKTSTKIQAIVDVDGVLAFIHPVSEEGTVASKWLGGDKQEARDTWIEASALTHIDETTPPILFIGSSFPRFLAGRGDVINILDEHGTYNQTHLFEDAPHSFWLFHPWFKPTMEHTIEFLNEVLKI